MTEMGDGRLADALPRLDQVFDAWSAKGKKRATEPEL
jgi:hypothetical protein